MSRKSQKEEIEEKSYNSQLNFLIAAFVAFFTVYPAVLDLLDHRPNAENAIIYSAISVAFMFVVIIVISLVIAKVSANKK